MKKMMGAKTPHIFGSKQDAWIENLERVTKMAFLRQKEYHASVHMVAIDPEESKRSIYFIMPLAGQFASARAAAEVVREMAKKLQIYMYAFVSEAWVGSAAFTRAVDMDKYKYGDISKSADKTEALWIIYETATTQKNIMIEINRYSNGSPYLGKRIVLDEAEGALTNVLYDPSAIKNVN